MWSVTVEQPYRDHQCFTIALNVFENNPKTTSSASGEGLGLFSQLLYSISNCFLFLIICFRMKWASQGP